MSTYFNEQTQEYENLEAAIIAQLVRLDGLVVVPEVEDEPEEEEDT